MILKNQELLVVQLHVFVVVLVNCCASKSVSEAELVFITSLYFEEKVLV